MIGDAGSRAEFQRYVAELNSLFEREQRSFDVFAACEARVAAAQLGETDLCLSSFNREDEPAPRVQSRCDSPPASTTQDLSAYAFDDHIFSRKVMQQ